MTMEPIPLVSDHLKTNFKNSVTADNVLQFLFSIAADACPCLAAQQWGETAPV